MGVTVATDLERVVQDALAEDVETGDLTTDALVPAHSVCRAELLLEEPGVVSGLAAAGVVFRTLDPETTVELRATDGDRFAAPPTVLAVVECSARALLTAERTALNFLGRLSGVATLTRAYVDAVAGTGAVVLDTRKTTPGLRVLEKDAVRHGGGSNHRLGLHDSILVKDNHLRLAGGIGPAVVRLRAECPGMPVEVEVESLTGLEEALAAGADRILLDNMPVAAMAEAVRVVQGRVPLEASGGITLDTIRAVAETGVDFISVGALTRSARSLDVSMEVLL